MRCFGANSFCLLKTFKKLKIRSQIFVQNKCYSYICHVIFFIVLDLRLTRLGESVLPFFMPFWLFKKKIAILAGKFLGDKKEGAL